MSVLRIPSLNLMPAARAVEMRRRARLRVWIGVTVFYTAGLVFAWMAVAARSASGISPEGKLQAAATRIEGCDAQLKVIRAAMVRTRREVEAARDVQEHPDWSVLLARLHAAAGEGVTLERCDLRPQAAKEPQKKMEKSTGTPAPAFMLTLAGVASSNAAVAQFSTSLERLRLFESVSIASIRSRDAARGRAMEAAGPLFNFEVVCVLSDAGVATASAATNGGSP